MTTLEHSSHNDTTSGCVLVIDDNDPVRRLLSVALETAGFEIVEAATRHEARRRLAHTRPDALVLDLQRSVKDGLALLSQLRARPDLTTIPVVFLAACGDDDLKWQAMRAGADWFAQRPVGMMDLAEHLKKLVQTGRPRLRPIAGTTRSRRVPIRRLKRVG